MKSGKLLLVICGKAAAVLVFAAMLGGCPWLMPPGISEVSDLLVTPGEMHLEVSWSNPAEPGFSHVLIDYKRVDSAEFTPYAEAATASGTVLYPLEAGTAWKVRVRTVYGDGRISDGVSAEAIPTADIDPPDVTDLTVTPGASSLIISWTDPDVVDYDHVEIWYGVSPDISNLFAGTAAAAGTEIDGLVPGTLYALMVKVKDAAGNGSPGVGDSGTPLEYAPTIYAVGDTGPAGGNIFYVDAAEANGWRYLEAAPISWRYSTNHTFVWATSGYAGTVVTTTDTIASGEANTAAIIATLGDGLNFAAHVCADLTYSGFNDWFLPSMVQLEAIYDNLHAVAAPTGSFDDDPYWSSIQDAVVNNNYAYALDFSDGAQVRTYKANARNVRPVRAFTFDEMVSAPVIAVADGAGGTKEVTITCSTPDSAIYYTTDGSEPSEATGIPYTAPFSLSAAATVKALAVRGGWDDSVIIQEIVTF